MISEPSIMIHEIEYTLKAELALGKISKETYDLVTKSLQLDYKRKEWEKRQKQQSKEEFCKELEELLRFYNAQIHIPISKWELCFNYWSYAESENNYLDADTISLFPKQRKRVDMVTKALHSFSEEAQSKCHVDKIVPLYNAARKVSGFSKVSDKALKEKINEFKEYMKSLETEN